MVTRTYRRVTHNCGWAAKSAFLIGLLGGAQVRPQYRTPQEVFWGPRNWYFPQCSNRSNCNRSKRAFLLGMYCNEFPVLTRCRSVLVTRVTWRLFVAVRGFNSCTSLFLFCFCLIKILPYFFCLFQRIYTIPLANQLNYSWGVFQQWI